MLNARRKGTNIELRRQLYGETDIDDMETEEIIIVLMFYRGAMYRDLGVHTSDAGYRRIENRGT
ncbi:hypothetical protein DPMN_063040 [Dreissena polymorpha]|uniref:Uncharacterized protein n=1 Tax=Dreissena polymorpha TaxID=45954 RepID=A0A9D4C9R6_DREPO|nr:hypothetical protein DPMN_063040 [Dreissena polymorpha]